MWEAIKENYLAISNYGVILALIAAGIVTSCNHAAEVSRLQAELETQQSDRPLIDIEQPVQQLLTQFAKANQAKPKPVEALPAATTNAIARMRDDINRLAQMVEQNRNLNSLLISNGGGNRVMRSPLTPGVNVDRNGNTEEALNDLYSPVNVPVLQDALAKGLARHPGSRVIVHPETGIPVLANYEWVDSHGGRVQELKRANGIERPVTIHYSAPKAKPEPKPEPFRLSLGNN